jgi:adenosylcobyric acid synthase
MARALMIQGTGSHAGKSMLVTALCRIFRQQGYRVAPFKAQNMALNSFVTEEGGEMGRAQVVQAEAAGITPSVHMNPVLIKPQTDCGAQVIIHGKAVGIYSAVAYHRFKMKAFKAVKESYARLARLYDLIIIEGAGSPAEVNLKKNDIVNMRIAAMARAPVLLVADIDRGGVFASLVGTMELLAPAEKRRVKGFVINKFRGDASLLAPGLTFLRRKTGVRVVGVIPFFRDIVIPDEDSVSLEGKSRPGAAGAASIAVVRLPHISNFTDFEPLEKEAQVALRYAERPQELRDCGAIIIPGSKNTIADLSWLMQTGCGGELLRHYERGGVIVGICGGFQMLGEVVKDPFGVEGARREMKGLGLLSMETRFLRRKTTFQVEAQDIVHGSEGRAHERLKGYEIHVGKTVLSGEASRFLIRRRSGKPCRHYDGAVSPDGRIWGTYIHGIFDNDGLRRRFIKGLKRDGAGAIDKSTEFEYAVFKEQQLDRLADLVREELDMRYVEGLIGDI